MRTRDAIRQAKELILSSLDELHTADIEDDEDGGKRRAVYLGTVMSLTPSGKYYLPFACSNVNPCPRCKGATTVANKHYNPALFQVVDEYEQQVCGHLLKEYGMYSEFPQDLRAFLDLLRNIRSRVQEKIECSYCGGVGSREAYLDEVWNETTEETASEHGAYMFSGEDDPCDLFLGESVEETEEVEA